MPAGTSPRVTSDHKLSKPTIAEKNPSALTKSDEKHNPHPPASHTAKPEPVEKSKTPSKSALSSHIVKEKEPSSNSKADSTSAEAHDSTDEPTAPHLKDKSPKKKSSSKAGEEKKQSTNEDTARKTDHEKEADDAPASLFTNLFKSKKGKSRNAKADQSHPTTVVDGTTPTRPRTSTDASGLSKNTHSAVTAGTVYPATKLLHAIGSQPVKETQPDGPNGSPHSPNEEHTAAPVYSAQLTASHSEDEQSQKSVDTFGSRKSSFFSRQKNKSIISSDPYQSASPEVPPTPVELKDMVTYRIHEIQRYRDDVKILQDQLGESKQVKEGKVKNLEMLTSRHGDLRKQLARELVVHDDVTVKLDATEAKLVDVIHNQDNLDLSDKFACQMQDRVHGDISASLEGYSDYYTSLMFSKMKTLEVWHQLSQDFLEKTMAMNESHQKARRAYSAATSRYMRVKTARDQLSAEFRRLHEENHKELQNFQRREAETHQRDELILAKYRDQTQRCLVNRDLKYELVLEAKDNLVARIKTQIEALHKNFSGLETAGSEAVEILDELIRYRRIKSFSNNTTKLLHILPVDSDYTDHLEKIQKTLSEYVACIHEIDNKRNDLLKERANLISSD